MVFNWLFDLPPIPHDEADGIRRFHPTPPTAKPKDLYHEAINGCSIPGLRYIHVDNSCEALIYIDGACSNEGTPYARAGYGIKWSSCNFSSTRLEGSDRETSHRAELRAAIVALGLRVWNGEGFSKVVLACDSEYVVKGISDWVVKWKTNGCQDTRIELLENEDLWEALRTALWKQDDRGVLVQFWLIQRKDNEADVYAKAGTFDERGGYMGEVRALDIDCGT